MARFARVSDYGAGLQPVLMQPVRLFIGTIREALVTTSATLSKHLTTLRHKGYIETHAAGRRTSSRLTSHGADRLIDHLAALQGVVTTSAEIVAFMIPAKDSAS